MNARFLGKVTLFVLAVLCVQSLTATTVNIYVVPGPNNNSPSYSAYVANMLSGIPTGTPQGNPLADPAAWAPVIELSPDYLLDTFSDFNSWKGSAGPTGAFANEWGTDLYAAVDINGHGQKVSLTGLTFMVDLGVFGTQIVTFTGADTYAFDRVGYIGGVPSVTSGSADQLVDEIRYVGVATFFPISCFSCTLAEQQSNLHDAALQIANGRPQVTFSYKNLHPAAGGTAFLDTSVTAEFVPEPATIGLGVIGLGIILFRKFSSRS